MIQDFSNPHNPIKPIRVEDIDTPKKEYKIERRQGLYSCYEKEKKQYELMWDKKMGGVAIYPTLADAENFITRDAMQDKNYYYEL